MLADAATGLRFLSFKDIEFNGEVRKSSALVGATANSC
jgi:hypothetical protein